MARSVIGWALAALVAFTLASIGITSGNALTIVRLGHPVAFDQWLYAIASDWLGMLGSYLFLIAIGLAIGLGFTSLCLCRFLKASAFLYALAGFVAILTIHLMMQQLLGMTPVAPVRFWYGLLSQALAGAMGGYVYYRFNCRSV